MIDFDKMQGLAPAVIQDAGNGDLLMVGFMNREALDMTLRTGFVTFYSRTRQTLWTKGESSGNRLQVVAAVDRLRSGYGAAAGPRAGRGQGLPHGNALLFYAATSAGESLTIVRQEGRSDETATGHSQRKFAGSDA